MRQEYVSGDTAANTGAGAAGFADAPDLGAVFAALPGGAAVFAPDAPRFTLLAASDALLALVGQTREAMVGLSLAQAFPGGDADQSGPSRLRASLEETLRTGAPQTMERQRYDIQRPADGVWEERYWDARNIPVFGPDGRVRYVLHQTEEVTARVRAEQRLRESEDARHASEERFRAIVTQATVGIAETAKGRFTYVNDHFCQITGRNRDDLIGKQVRDISHPDDGPRDMERLARMYATGEPFVVEKRYVRPDGSLVWVLNSVSPIRDAGGDVVGGFAVCTDVTERKQAEDERARALDELRRAYERERAIAQVLQRPLTVPVASDAFAGLTIATCYEPASGEADVGGDFFDALALPQGRVALALSDTSGKGLRAAARAIQVKEVLRAFTREHPHSPAHITARVNEYVLAARHFDPDQAPGEQFVTLLLAIVDPRTGEASVVSAGADPPLVLRAGGGVEVIETPRPGSFPLGVEAGEIYHSIPLHLAPGDTLLLTTDGLTETRRAKTHFLGLKGLAHIAHRALQHTTSLPEAAERIVTEARRFGQGRFRDDVCLLLARRH